MFRWKSKKVLQSVSHEIPTNSGVYVLMESKRINGLSVENRVLYVGKSKNLRRRFLDYSNPRKVHNEMVGERLFHGNVEFWCTKVEPNDLDRIERKFIHEFKAPMNKIIYKEFNNERAN